MMPVMRQCDYLRRQDVQVASEKKWLRWNRDAFTDPLWYTVDAGYSTVEFQTIHHGRSTNEKLAFYVFNIFALIQSLKMYLGWHCLKLLIDYTEDDTSISLYGMYNAFLGIVSRQK